MKRGRCGSIMPSPTDAKLVDNIFLIGPMGSGKTSLGRRVAARLELDFIDLYEELERRCGVEVAVIFDIEGEAGFRQREHDLLADIAQRRKQLIATGGGVILDPRNRQLINAHGYAIWLKASVDQQIRRLERDRRRPLLAAPDRRARLNALAEQRNPIYAETANQVLESRNLPVARMADLLESALRPVLDTADSAL